LYFHGENASPREKWFAKAFPNTCLVNTPDFNANFDYFLNLKYQILNLKLFEFDQTIQM
jgi:hypothetical protein